MVKVGRPTVRVRRPGVCVRGELHVVGTGVGGASSCGIVDAVRALVDVLERKGGLWLVFLFDVLHDEKAMLARIVLLV